MKFAIAVSFAMALAPFSHVAALPANQTVVPRLAPFGINFGRDSTGNVVTWVSGETKCNHIILGSRPCNQPFTANGQSFTLQGCGEQLSVRTFSGALFANCGVLSEADECGVHSDFHCI
ncbi:hypothetical protein C8J57DRAFT_382756 [Mycena rebaudengoi]|nr:hypothetical protein C8J57DRAFT_382756 [Mycena rebaudengoi]